jgi:transcriptional regulator with XRE-family HTH domain
VTDPAAFGNALQRRRVEAQLTQQDLADRAGIGVRTLRDLESGRVRCPRSSTVRLLADVLGLRDADAQEFAHLGMREYWKRRAEEPLPQDALPPPHQLPPGVAAFIGREPEIATITAVLTSTAPAIVAIDGMGGVGKTSLAIHVAHRVADLFPDGQLYVNLRDRTTGALQCRLMREVCGAVLEIPDDLDEAAAHLRSAITGRRMLIVLDDATDVEQVAALLPGALGTAAVITGRRVMSGLPQAHHVSLRLPTEDDAIAQLAATVGWPRVDRERDAAEAVVRRCGLLPLAVHMAGMRLASRPQWSIRHLARRLAGDARRLDELERADCSVRACFAASVDRLVATRHEDARAFGLLGRLDNDAVTVKIAAHLWGLSEADAEGTLERLADLHLIEAESPTRYRMNDLLRLYAKEFVSGVVTDVADARHPVGKRAFRVVW